MDRPSQLSWWSARVFRRIRRLVVHRHRMGGGNCDEYSRRCATCVSCLPLRCSSNVRLTQWLNSTGVPMFHYLGFAMVHHCFSVIDIPGFLWYADCNPLFVWCGGSLLSPRIFLFFSPFSVLAIFTIVETALPDRSVLRGGNPVHLVVAWASLTVTLNIIVTSMICFRLLRARALTLGALSPEMSRMYTSIVAILIESAAPFTIIGIGLVVTTAKNSPLTYAFADIWSLFCVESNSSHAPF